MTQALGKVAETPESEIELLAFADRAAYELFGVSHEVVNERFGHANVLRVMDRAIELAEADASPRTEGV